MKTSKFLLVLMIFFLVLPVKSENQESRKRLKVGLVLGGGGAKGAAEAGVLKIIEETGMPIDYIAGTSIGSIVGGLYACGYRSADLDTLFCSQNWKTLLADRNREFDGTILKKKDGITYFFGFPISRKKSKSIEGNLGAIRGDSVVAFLDRLVKRPDSIDFRQLPIPFSCVAVDLTTMTEVVLKSGRLSQAMRASMAIPGVYTPEQIGDYRLIDGGTLNNLPVDVVRAMGADVVIAIDLTQNKRQVRDKSMNHKRKGLSWLIEWATRRPDLVKYNQNIKDCDVYINPDLKGFNAASFSPEKIQEMIQRGEAAGEKARDQLVALKKRVDRSRSKTISK
ncbi:patatin-like phospholipase family protein [Prevotella cerevisiae]|uniref:Patatin-like phospholipase family protein n=1 Tax=Segatella cerevisiae TaxID=2053716 RepID=A0ABT1BWB7_9BACT|nr:patatin-like phospholipase family protein [Segatella cerevisiae]MCO6025372.1 patatin-like phospholipase family protein [Segatella cerevisiae]